MTKERIEYLKQESKAERLDLVEISEIENEFSKLPDGQLRDLRENATVNDMLDELEAAMKIDCECGGCDWTGNSSTLDLGDIEDLLQRIDPGSEVPAGTCPECGALAYLLDEHNPYYHKPKIIVFVEGGIVQDCIATMKIDCVVIDSDTDGGSQEHIRQIEGQNAYVNRCDVTIDQGRATALFTEATQ